MQIDDALVMLGDLTSNNVQTWFSQVLENCTRKA